MSKSTKQSRARHFDRGAAMSDDDPRAYEPAPGDKGKKTKPSKYTQKFKKMYGEEAKELEEKDVSPYGLKPPDFTSGAKQITKPKNVKQFEEIRDMMRYATKIEICPAVCTVSGEDAYYTHRKLDAANEITVGGEELYEPRSWKYHSFFNVEE